MAVTWVGGAGNYTTVSGTLGVTLPAFVAGDLAVVIVSNDAGTDPNYVGPSGWTFGSKTAATNMYSYIWYRVLQAGDTTVGITAGAGGTISVGIWRNAAWVGLGTFGIRGASSYTVTAPNVASASGVRLHLFGDRTVASSAGEVDKLHTLTYGTPRYFHAGNPTLAAAVGISAAYFSDSLIGSGDNTATFADNATNAWGVQVAVNDISPPKTETLTDTFDTEVDKAVKWAATSTATVWEAGQAKIPCVTNYWNLGTPGNGTYDFTGSYFYAKVTPPATGNGTRETFMEVIRGGVSNDKLSLYVSGSDIYATRKLAGVVSGTSDIGVYNPTTDAWWRIRESGGTTYFGTSPDGTTWTDRWSVANGFDVTTVWLNFSTGYWGTETAASAFVDNVNTPPAVQTGGRPKAYVAGSFQKKPGKVWLGDTLATAGATAFGLATGPSTKTATVTVPATVTVGSLLLLTVTVTTGNIENWNTAVLSGGAGAGWTLLPAPTGTSGCNMFLWWKIATAGDPGSVVTYTAGAAGVASGVVAAICEVKGAEFHGADFYYNAGANQGSAAGMSGLPLGRQIVCAMGVRGTSDVGTMIVPTGWTVLGSTNTNAWASAKYYVMFAIRDAIVSGTVAAVTGAPGFDDSSGATFNRVSWSIFTGRWVEKPWKTWTGTAWKTLT